MIINAKVTLISCLCTLLLNIVIIWISSTEYSWIFICCVAVCIFLHAFLMRLSTNSLFQVIWRAYMLAAVFCLGIDIICLAPALYLSTGLYLCLLAVFHLGEYLATALFNPSTLKLDSFILNHSLEYNVALTLSWIEHAILLYFFPGMKTSCLIIFLGFILSLVGDTFRKTAMYTAGKNFNHVVQYHKKENHVLITNGVYGICRHPSYAGWFCWSISTQILLSNPVCLVAYAIASWKFFEERIYMEELTLLNFFQDQYVEYKKKVPSGIPFVKGFDLKGS